MGGLDSVGNFLNLGKNFLILARFFFWESFNKFWAKNRKFIIFGQIFTTEQHWFFKSVHLAANTLYLTL